ncbi:hypothetical protein DOY81_013974 [Sarcophaga bullata]|nr:hypothetical protein DOY81_013974 [Sarcophaga bullata]
MLTKQKIMMNWVSIQPLWFEYLDNELITKSGNGQERCYQEIMDNIDDLENLNISQLNNLKYIQY